MVGCTDAPPSFVEFGRAALEVLAARDRWHRRREALLAHPSDDERRRHPSAVELSVVLPGLPKRHLAAARVFEQGLLVLQAWLLAPPILEERSAAGYFALFRSPQPAKATKRQACELEAAWPWTRLWDIDVRDHHGPCSRRQLGWPPRACLLCGDDHETCIGARRHQVENLRAQALLLAAEVR